MLKKLKDKVFSTLPVGYRFRRIYSHNQWGSEESVSGEGSTLAYTENVRNGLGHILYKHKVASIVDVACGDFNWMRVFLQDYTCHYTGVDIVSDVIAANKAQYGSENVEFYELNVIESIPPLGDITLFRDCILHLSFDDGMRALRNIAKSGSPFVLTSSYPQESNSEDIVTGRWRRVNLMEPPYNLPAPIQSIDENAPGKILGVWKCSDLSHL